MQLKNSMLLLTALTAGSAVGRLHGHDRRHTHPNNVNVDAGVADVEVVDKRGAPDMVYATINGVLESWINNWSGQSTSTSTTTTVQAPAVQTDAVQPATNTAPAPTTAQTTAAPAPPAPPAPTSPSGSGAAWSSSPANGQYSTSGFGGRTGPIGSSSAVNYAGNVGMPWGSNIILVPEASASQYKHVLRFEGSNIQKWTVIFWNKIGPNGGMNGWYGNKALQFSLSQGEVKYVAIDDDSQGAFGAAPGDTLPVDNWGGWASTWGEWDMSNAGNGGWSGWDVSAIQAQAAGFNIQGMQICAHDNIMCSAIANSLPNAIQGLLSAYTQAQQYIGGIGGKTPTAPVRLAVTLNHQ